MNLVFAGTPDFAAGCLTHLIKNDLTPSLVLTQPDRKAGRGRKLQPSSVKQVALNHDIHVYQPEKLDDDARAFLRDLPQPDVLIVVAYGLLLPQWTLDWAKYGAINVHASRLPRWRGAAPIQRAIAAGDAETGVSIMQMDAGLDTGDVWLMRSLPIGETMTASELHDALLTLSQPALLDTLALIQAGDTKPTPQSDEGVTYAHKLSKAEAKIDWTQPAEVICRHIRAYNPVPVAHTEDENGETYRIFTAHLGNVASTGMAGHVTNESTEGIVVQAGKGEVVITELQQTGKKRVSVRDFLNARSLKNMQFQV